MQVAGEHFACGWVPGYGWCRLAQPHGRAADLHHMFTENVGKIGTELQDVRPVAVRRNVPQCAEAFASSPQSRKLTVGLGKDFFVRKSLARAQ